MNVGIVLPYFKAGGTERQARYIARHLRYAGHNVTFIIAEKKGIFAKDIGDDAIFLDVSFRKTSAPLLLYQLTKTVRGEGFDLLLSRAWNMNILTAIAGLTSGIPYVLFLSGPSKRTGQPKPKLLVERFFLRRAARIVSVSEAARENCIRAYGLPPSLVEVVHNGIRIEEVQSLAERESEDAARIREDAFNIVFVGRVNHRKGVDLLLRALAVNERRRRDEGRNEQGKSIHLWIVGGGNIEKYRDLAEELGVETHVSFLGGKENPFPELSRADLFVLPSRSEGFPNVLLEAMALGRPVLAADCDTGPDEVVDGKNGRLFPVEDHRALAQNIHELIGNSELREMGERAQHTVRDHFRLSTQLAKIEEILQRAASEKEGA